MNSSFSHYLVTAFAVLGVLSILAAHRELSKMKANSPDVLARVGIVQIDWWWKCIRGVYRLGFSSAGDGLPMRTKMTFISVIFTYVWISVFSIFVLLTDL